MFSIGPAKWIVFSAAISCYNYLVKDLKNFLANKINQAVPLMAVFTLPCQGNVGIGECIADIYTVSLSLVGIVAFVQIVIGGFLVLTAAGNTAKYGEAMNKIKNAVFGIVLLFSSYLILRTINPDLVKNRFTSFEKIELKKEQLAKPRDLNDPVGSKDFAQIETFTFKPDIFGLNDPRTLNLNFSLGIFGTASGIEKACPGANDVDFGMRFDLFVLESGKNERSFETSLAPTDPTLTDKVTRLVFGDGKKISFGPFKVPIKNLGIGQETKTARIYAKFLCFKAKDNNWAVLSESRHITATIAP